MLEQRLDLATPDGMAVAEDGTAWSHAEFESHVAAIVAGLVARLGDRPGPVALGTGPGRRSAVALAACWRAGLTTIPHPIDGIVPALTIDEGDYGESDAEAPVPPWPHRPGVLLAGPRGPMFVPHDALTVPCLAQAGERVLSLAPIDSPAYLTPLATGSTLIHADDPQAVLDAIDEWRVDSVWAPPHRWRELVEAGLGDRRRVRAVLCDQPLTDPELAAELLQCTADLRQVYASPVTRALYGAARITDPSRIPLARPLPGTRFYVLDARAALVPLGARGMLHVGGAERAELVGGARTGAEVFLPDPYAIQPGGRMHATGDLVRLHADGTLVLPGQTARRTAAATAPGSRDAREAVAAISDVLVKVWTSVLGTQVGPDDDFFDLGGDSLLTIQAITQLRAALGVELRVSHVMENSTVDRLAAVIHQMEATGPAAGQETEHALPTLAQDAVLRRGGNPSQVVTYDLRGDLRPAALTEALVELLNRHESLRATFADRDGRTVLVISPHAELDLRETSVRDLPAPLRAQEAERVAAELAAEGYDLRTGPLVRVLLIELDEGYHLLVFCAHAAVFDRWSVGVLSRELAALYRAHAWAETAPPLPEARRFQGELRLLAAIHDPNLAGLRLHLLPAVRTLHGRGVPSAPPPHAALARAERELVASRVRDSRLEYWRGFLAQYGDAPQGLGRYAWVPIDLPAGLPGAAAAGSRTRLLALTAAAIRRVTGQPATTAAVDVPGRQGTATRAIARLGDARLVRVDSPADSPMDVLVDEAARAWHEACRHALPLPLLSDELGVSATDLRLTVEDEQPGLPASAELRFGERPSATLTLDGLRATYVVEVRAEPGGGFTGRLGYDTGLSDEARAERIVATVRELWPREAPTAAR